MTFFLGNFQGEWLGLWTISYPSKAKDRQNRVQNRKVGEKSIDKVRFDKKKKRKYNKVLLALLDALI